MSGIDIVLRLTVAIVPPLLLLVITYLIDWKEREPLSLLFFLTLLGIGSFFVAFLWEMGAFAIINHFFKKCIFVRMIKAFLVIGLGEELVKFLCLRIGSWRHSAFDYRFDGIVYAVYVSLGFAMTENVFYVMNRGYHTALYRSISSIPLHASCGVIMGIFYGYAKGCFYAGNTKGKKKNMNTAIILSTIVHGFYDFSMVAESLIMGIIWMVFTLILFFIVLNRLMKYCALDHKIAVCDSVQGTNFGEVVQDVYDASESPTTQLMFKKQRYDSYGQTSELNGYMSDKDLTRIKRNLEED